MKPIVAAFLLVALSNVAYSQSQVRVFGLGRGMHTMDNGASSARIGSSAAPAVARTPSRAANFNPSPFSRDPYVRPASSAVAPASTSVSKSDRNELMASVGQIEKYAANPVAGRWEYEPESSWMSNLNRASEYTAGLRISDQCSVQLRRRAAEYVRIGVALRTRAHFEFALDDLRRAQRIKEETADSATLAGIAHLCNEEFDAAIHSLDTAIAADANSARAHYYRGVALRAGGKLDQAANEFNIARTLEPTLAK